jgi:hypothetical protein
MCFVFWHYLAWGCFGYFSKNWAIFSKSSGHPVLQMLDYGGGVELNQTGQLISKF